MRLTRYLNHPQIQKLTKSFKLGEFLFHQGQSSNSMYYIVSGAVELLAQRDDEVHIENILVPGEYFGERALIGDKTHQRLFAARAREDLKVVEIAREDLEVLQATVPGILPDILRGVFEITAQRLDRANYLVRSLRSSKNEARLVAVIEYFCHSAARQKGRVIEVTLSVDSLHYYLDMDKTQIAKSLENLTNQGLLLPQKKGIFLVPDEARLLQYLQSLQAEKKAA